MRLHRFILGEINLSSGKHLKIFNTEALNQIKNVLRLKIGESFILGDGNLNEAIAKITEFSKDFFEVEISEVYRNTNEPPVRVILYASVLKRENFEFVIQKAVEAGVSEIVPVLSRRTVKTGLRTDRLVKIIKEAAEQSGRGVLPTLAEARELDEAMKDASHNDLNLFFDLSGDPIKNLNSSLREVKVVGVFIGPEGGWDESEVSLAKEKNNFKILNLGKLTLRAETAAIASTYLAANLFLVD